MAQDSFEPFGGSYCPISEASWAYSLVWGWSVSQGGWASFSPLPMTGVSEFGPLVSLTMIALTFGDDFAAGGPPGELPPGGAPTEGDRAWSESPMHPPSTINPISGRESIPVHRIGFLMIDPLSWLDPSGQSQDTFESSRKRVASQGH
jgi:hypothetical protein